MCSTMIGGGWRLAVGNWWLVAVGGGWRRLVVGDWWLVIGGWWLVAVGSGWQLAVGRRWRLAAVGGWQLVAVGGWRLAVGGPLGRSLRAVLRKKKSRPLRTALYPCQPAPAMLEVVNQRRSGARRHRLTLHHPGLLIRYRFISGLPPATDHQHLLVVSQLVHAGPQLHDTLTH